jgi:hypothetical protein
MSITGNLYLVLSSDNENSTGDASAFTQVLGQPLLLNNNANYEVCLVDFECPTPNPYTNKPVHITADICVMSDVNGSLERLVGRSMVDMPTPLEKEQLKVKSSTPEWVRLSKTSFENVSITIKDDSDVSVPVGSGKRSSLTLSIRAVQ